MGGMVHPMRSSDSIMWTVKFRNGNMKRFKFPIRTTAEGAANPYADLKGENLDDQRLSTEKALVSPDPAKMAK
jgi:adenylylsulfate reductase subunit B